MLRQTSKEFRAFFLLEFTRELIRHSETGEIIELENVVKEDGKKSPFSIKEKIKQKEKLFAEEFAPIKHLPSGPEIQRPAPQVLRIPQIKLPSRLQYLRPTPTNIQIDLGKLNPLLKDPMVQSIECVGADKNIVVRGNMGTKKTNIVLSKKEIDGVIEKLAETAKIPMQEGVFKVAVGKLILSAIISQVVSSRFIIQKMKYAPREIFGRR
jgi:hypothetical protein